MTEPKPELREIRAKRDTQCVICGQPIREGDLFWWSPREIVCEDCWLEREGEG